MALQVPLLIILLCVMPKLLQTQEGRLVVFELNCKVCKGEFLLGKLDILHFTGLLFVSLWGNVPPKEIQK